MKVGTDGVLLGAWVSHHLLPITIPSILDVGTGSGLIALMLAQRLSELGLDFHITGIDIDEGAVEQANINFSASQWANHLTATLSDIQTYAKEIPPTFHLIISNPPYFVDSLKAPDAQRSTARHTDTLSYKELIFHATRLLDNEGMLCLIAPADEEQHLLHLCALHNLRLTHLTRFYTSQKPNRPPKRILLAAQKKADELSHLPIIDALYMGSDEYHNLVKDYYLH